MTTAARMDELMHRAWPVADVVDFDGWVARRAAGVTQRANSVLPIGAPGDLPKALSLVESHYLSQGLVPRFQVGPASRPDGLDEVLAARGYEVGSPTLVQTSEIGRVLELIPDDEWRVNISSAPDDDWTDLWWREDGHGGDDAKAIARGILTGGRALYGSIREQGTVTAVARLALVDDWAALYCVVVDPAFRRQGRALAVMRKLLLEATSLGFGRVWLQVVAGNEPARALYARLGFETVSRYHYRFRTVARP
ncbi:GNAT family N-acetyltransferase [Kribbella monticola]|uniref:GNAT family N-acetyltransferase n=1 Tax=Kribbella monticola TaxID=2185285 RepID=UPI000DD3D49A|nr:GNAT family N-acetyltransferase [Kribbella monticola]